MKFINRHSETIKFWFNRAYPALACGLILLLLLNLYNVWSGLTLFYFSRRLTIMVSLVALLFGPSIFFRKNRSRLIYLLVVSTLASLLMIINFTYSKYAGGFLSVSALKYAKHLFEVSGSVKSLLSINQLLLLMPIVLSLGLLLFYKGMPTRKEKMTRLETVVATLVLIFVIMIGTGYTFYKEYKEWGDVSRLVNHPYNSDDLVRKIGIINYSLFDAAKYVTRKKNLTATEVEFVKKEVAKEPIDHSPNQLTGVARGKNIIYVQLESFQNFLIGATVNGREVTPNLNKLASTSYNMTNFHYQIGPGTSSDSEFVALNSLYHLGDKSVNFEYAGNKFYALPKFLKDKGYSTVAMHGDSPNFWNRGNVFANYGYDDYITREQYRGDNILWGLNDTDFFAQSAEKLTSVKQPFFAHLISLSSHSPFKMPEKYAQLDVAGLKLSQLQKDYLQAAHYSDSAVGELLEKLKTSQLYDNSIIMVGGDHEGFITTKDDSEFAKFLGFADGFDDLSFAVTRQVPLILHLPGQTEVAKIDYPAGQIDIYPTLTNLIGEAAPKSILGTDIFGVKKPIVTTRVRSIGQEIESIFSSDHIFIAGGHGDFSSGKCYALGQLVETVKCKPLYDAEITKMMISDKVVEGNRLDLLNL